VIDPTDRRGWFFADGQPRDILARANPAEQSEHTVEHATLALAGNNQHGPLTSIERTEPEAVDSDSGGDGPPSDERSHTRCDAVLSSALW
jgi:hypothetical protein